jgi:hypothetical protein
VLRWPQAADSHDTAGQRSSCNVPHVYILHSADITIIVAIVTMLAGVASLLLMAHYGRRAGQGDRAIVEAIQHDPAASPPTASWYPVTAPADPEAEMRAWLYSVVQERERKRAAGETAPTPPPADPCTTGLAGRCLPPAAPAPFTSCPPGRLRPYALDPLIRSGLASWTDG